MRSLHDTLRSSDFAVTAELTLSPQQSAEEIVSAATELAAVADAVVVPDHRNARPHISPVAIGAHLISAGINPVVRINCRDRNRIATQSDLLAARSFGIDNILLSRGSEIPEDHRPPASGVFDLTAIDLVRTAAAISSGDAMPTGGEPHEFFIGTVATAFSPKENWTPEKLTAKADAGAQFIQLQLCMNSSVLRNYVAHLVDARLTWRFQLIANVAVLPSVDDARALRQSNPESIIPSACIKRLELADDEEDEGITIAAELLDDLKDIPGIGGVNVQTNGEMRLIAEAIRRSNVRNHVSA